MFRYRSPAHFIDVFKIYYGPMLKALAALDEDSGRGPRSEKETQETRPLIRALSIVGHHRKG
jgi:hypothetical protein